MSIIAYDAGLKDGKDEAFTAVLELLDEMVANPPMRGDIAVSDIRREVKALAEK